LKKVGPIRLSLLAVALAGHAWAVGSATLRAADDGLPPEFCPTLRTVVAAAANRFESLRGAPEPGGDPDRKATTRLPGAIECSVFGGTRPAYACTLYAGDVEENADGTYERAAHGLTDCLGAEWRTRESVDGVHARTTTSAGAGPSVRVISRDASADGYLVELWVDAVRR